MERESDLEMTERHIRQVQERIALVKDLISELHHRGQSAPAAGELLAIFESSLSDYQQHATRLRGKAGLKSN
jgi:hypothetical protein